MLKRILVATDASGHSRHALSLALEFAKQFHADIELLHVVYPPRTYNEYFGGYSPSYSKEQIMEIGERVLEATLKGIDTNEVHITKKIVSGYPGSVILDETRRDVDLVIMGSHGHGPIIEAVTGSAIIHVLAEAPCPVLVVK
jgi:nucleotide-binding universal stress UspA family protein